MTLKEKSAIYRAIGKIEGVASVLDVQQASTLLEAVRMIEGTILKEDGDAE